MKPHYVLHEGQPVRVGWIQGLRVGLVPARPGSCRACVFHNNDDSRCPLREVSVAALGRDCIDEPSENYREFPQPLRSGE